MKNRFTSQKHEFEERCRTLKAECKQKQDLIGSVKTEIDRLKDLYRSTESEKQQR
jgi:cell shape-determining protein MreC